MRIIDAVGAKGSGVHAQNVPHEFCSCISYDFTWVRLTNRMLAVVPDWVRALTTVTKLTLDGNLLTELPEWLTELASLTELSLGGNRLTALPGSIGNLTTLTELNLGDNRLTKLPPSMGNLTGLTWLNLRGNALATLPRSLGNLTALTELNLGGNALTTLPESIGNLAALTELDVSGNELTTLPEAIGDLTALTELDLSGNKLTTLPEAIGNLTGLAWLSLGDNKMTTLPESIGNLSALTQLDICATGWSDQDISSLAYHYVGRGHDSASARRLISMVLPSTESSSTTVSSAIRASQSLVAYALSSPGELLWSGAHFGQELSQGSVAITLPESIGNLAALTTLDLRGTQVSALPESIRGLTALTTLDLRGTQVTAVPESIGNLSALIILDLSGTQVSALPESIRGLTALTTLDLRGTPVTALPDWIGGLTALTTLDLHGTQVTALPESIGGLTALTTLDLSSTPVTALPESIGGLTALTTLDLHGTPVTALPESIGSLTALTTLDLHGTQVTALPDSIGGLTALTTLDLSSTPVTALPDSIGNLTTLTTLDLHSTQVTALPDSIGNLTTLTTLDLHDCAVSPLPESIGGLTALTTLDLRGTQVTALPESIGNLTALTWLGLLRSQVMSLPESIGGLTALTTLDLRGTRVTALPESIGNLTALTTLDLNGTPLSALPQSIGGLRALTILRLRASQVSTLPESISNLTALTTLDLGDSWVSALPPSIRKLTSLTTLDLTFSQVSALPESIGDLTALTDLDLSGTRLTTLPETIGNLTALTTLDLSASQVSALPESIGNLTALTKLELSTSQVSALPESIGNLTGLTALDLHGTLLTALPESTGNLTGLTKLDLSASQVSALPESIGNLTALTALDLSGTRLTTLPEATGDLNALLTLDLRDSQISALPASIGVLSTITRLDLSGTKLTTLPESIGGLTTLTALDLHGTPLIALPESIGGLTRVTKLDLSGTRLTTLPKSIAGLTGLTELNLRGSRLTALPETIGDLAGLSLLDLGDNRLSSLPIRLANPLEKRLQLKVDGNPLDDPLPDLVARGASDLAAYLRSLVDAMPQYEAKLLLVGEGNVGKTSLVATLMNHAFVRDRPTTHGIEISPISFRHPHLDRDITLRAWDFGGQEVYRVTHQFFFSRRALYVVVWKAREGQEENQVEGWLRRIRLRVGPGARTMIVATHTAERTSELDYPHLQQLFPGMLAGNFDIDNLTKTGISKLRDAVAQEAAELPQMGQLISPRWTAARDEILALAEKRPHVPYEKFTRVCEAQGMTGPEVITLAKLMHDLGHIIYYGEDEGLKDIVVLNPEWLTKAISYVFEDKPTRESGGVLRHARLKEIWRGRKGGLTYPAKYHPYFLRLMEKFDVCYRLEGDEFHSLVAQLVPHQRPALPWQSTTSLKAGIRRLALVCRLSEPAPGLIPWLTVRHHRASTGLQWRRGIFLRHPISAYKSEALVELRHSGELAMEVRAPSPDLYFNVLRDSLEDLITHRWPGLSYQLLIPCPGNSPDMSPCPGLFPLNGLLKVRESGITSTVVCMECAQLQEISALLTGFTFPDQPLTEGIEKIHERLSHIEDGMIRAEGQAAETAETVRRIMRVVSTEVTDCPRLFTLTPEKPKGVNRAKIHQHHFRLTLWCEHPGYWHPWPKANYTLDPTKEWFAKIRPYAALMVKTLQLVVPLTGAIAVSSLPTEQIERAEAHLDVMKTLVEDIPGESEPGLSSAALTGAAGQLTSAEGQALRAIRAIIFENDHTKAFGGLRRVQAPSGEFLWVCEDHYREYDPGLPAVP